VHGQISFEISLIRIPITRIPEFDQIFFGSHLDASGCAQIFVCRTLSAARRLVMSVSLTNPIAINSYNVSSLRFNIDTLVDFTLDPLRRKDWRIFYTQQTDKLRANYRRQAKKYAYYYSLLVDSNPSLCFQDVIIQKSPLVNSTSHDHRTNAASYSNRQPRYGEDYIILGVPVQVVCEINQQLGKHYTIPIGTCQTIITGDHYWITVSPPPAYPPQVSLVKTVLPKIYIYLPPISN